MRTLVLTLIAVVFTVSTAAAQNKPAQTTRGPGGKAFINVEASSAADMAKKIRSCRTRAQIATGDKSPDGNLSCELWVESFNALEDIEDVANHNELADYVEELEYRRCPAGVGPVPIARVIMVDGKDAVDYITRPLRADEFCLRDKVRNRMVSSAFCGQWIRDPVANTFVSRIEDNKLSGGGGGGGGTNSNTSTGSRARWHDWLNPTKKKGALVWGAGAAVACGFFCRQEIDQEVRVRIGVR